MRGTQKRSPIGPLSLVPGRVTSIGSRVLAAHFEMVIAPVVDV